MAIIVGMTGSVTHDVLAADTARELGSGDVDVLGSPRVVAWCEAATLAAVNSGVKDSDVVVGIRISLEHIHPASIGESVTANATVSAADGRIVTFDVELVRNDDQGGTLLAHGEIVRVVLSREAFQARLNQGN
jgi:predicted thioesterase